MKVRYGFVSNSSSSSFVGIGVRLPACYFSDYIDKDDEEDAKRANEGVWSYPELDEFMRVLCQYDTRFTYNGHSYSDEVYIGISWSSMRPDETLSMVEDIVFNGLKSCKELVQRLKDDDKKLTIEQIEEIWRD